MEINEAVGAKGRMSWSCSCSAVEMVRLDIIQLFKVAMQVSDEVNHR